VPRVPELSRHNRSKNNIWPQIGQDPSPRGSAVTSGARSGHGSEPPDPKSKPVAVAVAGAGASAALQPHDIVYRGETASSEHSEETTASQSGPPLVGHQLRVCTSQQHTKLSPRLLTANPRPDCFREASGMTRMPLLLCLWQNGSAHTRSFCFSGG
jgi:hypothetical protein